MRIENRFDQRLPYEFFGRRQDFGRRLKSIIITHIHINDLHATILHLFGLEQTRLTNRFQGHNFRLTGCAVGRCW